ncbi:MAG: efflux RND transporter permease subunit, partial [Nannocystaceae bacterium]
IMSLGGLALGIGMLVDNSIVVLESIHRCREEGDDLIRATMRGTSEVGSAVMSSTLTSIAVFFPMVFVEGIAGQMFGDLGLTVVFSLLASLAVALFFIPMLASRRGFARDEADVDSKGRSRGVVRGLLQTWGSWQSVREVWADFKRLRFWLLLVVPLLYVLIRFSLHLMFEVVGKLLTTFGILFSAGVYNGGRGIGWVLGKVLSPFLWVFDKLMSGLENFYPRMIRWSLRNKFIVYAGVFAAFFAMVQAAGNLDTELIPELHQGEFTTEISLPVGTPLAVTDETVAPLEKELLANVPRLRNLVTTIGSERDSAESGERGEHTTRLRFTLTTQRSRASAKPRGGKGKGKGKGKNKGKDDTSTPEKTAEDPSKQANDDPKSAARGGPTPKMDTSIAEADALEIVRPILDRVPDATVNVKRPVLFSFTQPVEVEIRGYELGELGQSTRLVAKTLGDIDGLRDVKSSILPGSPEIQIVYDRDALARYNLNIRTVAELVRNKVQGFEATKYNRKDRKIPVRVRLQGITEASIDELKDLVVNPGQARPVPLNAVAEITLGRGPNEIRRIDQQRVGLVTANVEGSGLGNVVGEIRRQLGALDLPASVEVVVTGQSEEWETSSQSLYLALGLSIFLVYVIMASQFESLVYPLIILATIPLAGLGVI